MLSLYGIYPFRFLNGGTDKGSTRDVGGKIGNEGEMAEWLKVLAWKASVEETLPRVRISLSPPKFGIQISAKNMVGTKCRLFCIPPKKS